MEIYFGSDFHAYHKNLCIGSSNWDDKERCRDFDNEEEMTNVLVENINKTVGKNDILYHLGDWSFAGKQNIYNFRKRLYVKTIHLILGNHDLGLRNNSIIKLDNGKYVNSQNLFTSCQEILHKKIGGINMALCHYPIASFYKQNRGGIHLHGHVHFDKTIYNKRGLNVCIDNHSEFKPFHIEEVKNIINSRI